MGVLHSLIIFTRLRDGLYSSGEVYMIEEINKKTKGSFNKLFNELLLKSFHGINDKNEGGDTILHLAAEFSSAKTVKLLIEKGADVNVKNHKGETALHRAAHRGKVRNLKEIIKAGGMIDARDNEEFTPLHYAAMFESKGNIKCAIKKLIDAGADINAQNNKQRTPLHEAVYIIKDMESIRTLIQRGCDVNLADDNGRTALHYASMGNDERVVEMLIEAGASTNAINRYGLKSIFYAEMRGKIEEMLKVKRERKELNKIGEGYKNIKPRDMYKEMLKEIEGKSYKGINEKNKDGKTVLHLAASYGSAEKIKELIEKGADINIGDNKGMRALHYAALFRKIKAAQVLIEKGADINTTDNGMHLPLHLACLTGGIGVVKVLVKAGANINAINRLNDSPLCYARNKAKIANLLQKKGAKIIDKTREVDNEIEDKEIKDVLGRLFLPDLEGKIFSLDEIKKRDELLIMIDLLKLCEKKEDLVDEVTSLKKGLDEEKD